MNRKEISNMQPSKRLRELIALEVMGWELCDVEPLDDRPREYWWRPETKESRAVESWHPDKNIMDAWLVAQRLGESGLLWELRNAENGRANGYYFIVYAGEETYGQYAETAPLAICRAALLAVVTANNHGV